MVLQYCTNCGGVYDNPEPVSSIFPRCTAVPPNVYTSHPKNHNEITFALAAFARLHPHQPRSQGAQQQQQAVNERREATSAVGDDEMRGDGETVKTQRAGRDGPTLQNAISLLSSPEPDLPRGMRFASAAALARSSAKKHEEAGRTTATAKRERYRAKKRKAANTSPTGEESPTAKKMNVKAEFHYIPRPFNPPVRQQKPIQLAPRRPEDEHLYITPVDETPEARAVRHAALKALAVETERPFRERRERERREDELARRLWEEGEVGRERRHRELFERRRG